MPFYFPGGGGGGAVNQVTGSGLAVASPSTGNVVVSLAAIASDTVVGNSTGGSAVPTALSHSVLTTLIDAFSGSLKGAVPVSSGVSTDVLHADGSWSTPGGAPGGANEDIQYNSSGSFAGSADFQRQGAGNISIGQSMTTSGQLLFYNASAFSYIGIQGNPLSSSGNILTLPVVGTNLVSDTATQNLSNKTLAEMIGSVATIASATTTDLGSAAAPVLTVTGTTTITSFGATAVAGQLFFLEFSGILTITNNATSLILPNNGGSIGTLTGDTATVLALGSGNFRVVNYSRVNGGTTSTPGVFGAAAASGGSANAQTIATTRPQGGFGLNTGQIVSFVAGFSNTTAMTLNVVGSGVKNLLVSSATGPRAAVTGDVIAGNAYAVIYDGTEYVLQV